MHKLHQFSISNVTIHELFTAGVPFSFLCFLIRMIFDQGEKMLGDNPRIIR